MAMFDHVGITVSDRAASEAFYETVLSGVLGHAMYRAPAFTGFAEFVVHAPAPGRPVTRRLHVGFAAASRAQVDAFWQAGVDAGHRSDGAPGERDYTPGYYGAFLLDPDGNSIEAVHYDGVERHGAIDHVWMRVLDVPSATAFYATIADAAHLRPGPRDAEYAIFRIASGASLSLVAGDPTEGAHLAFSGTRADVQAFHAAALAGGYRDNGAPGERPQYEPGYYAAFAFDADANNIEVVDRPR